MRKEKTHVLAVSLAVASKDGTRAEATNAVGLAR